MYAWMGTILRVGLSTGKVEKEPLNDELRLNYLGGRGINSRILFNSLEPRLDALSPENVLIFGTGPLVGTVAPSSGRMSLTAKSPLTGILGDSNVGSHFSLHLKRAGYDHIVFTGKAKKPVYLWIDDDHVELRPADHLWGRMTSETEDMIRGELGDPTISIASIGPGGENLVKYGCVICNSYDAAGRTGMGAVMGSKNLKAVAIRGTKGVKIADPEAFLKLASHLQERIVNNRTYKGLAYNGTIYFSRVMYELGLMGAKNFQLNTWPGFEKIDHRVWKRDYLVKASACTACPRHCHHAFVVKEGPYAGTRGGKIEHFALCTFGCGCLIDNPAAIGKATSLCDNYGLDIAELGTAVSTAMEWYQKGLITKGDTDGVDLIWGNDKVLIEMIHKIAKRQGFGDLLAEGVVRAAKIIGKGADKAIGAHAKGVAVNGGDDMRYFKGYALSAATSTRGFDHLRGMAADELMPVTPIEILRKRFGSAEVGVPSSYDKSKAALVSYHQNVATLADCMEICKYVTDWCKEEINIKDMSDLFSLATGIDMDEMTMSTAADRVFNVERAFLVREGITRKDDVVLGRLSSEPIADGPLKDAAIDPEKFDKLLGEYYKLRGWDLIGIPTSSTLSKLGLKDVDEKLIQFRPSPAKVNEKGKSC